MLKEVVAKTLQKHGIAEDHKCFPSCSQRLFEISKFYLKVTRKHFLTILTAELNESVPECTLGWMYSSLIVLIFLVLCHLYV